MAFFAPQLGASVTLSPVGPGGHTITFVEVRYDYPAAGQSTWYYTVFSKGPPAISHVTFGLDCPTIQILGAGTWDGINYDSLDAGKGKPEPNSFPSGPKGDPTTQTSGIKFDLGFNENQTRHYYFTVNGNYDATDITVAVKAGPGFGTGKIPGPNGDCSSSDPCTAKAKIGDFVWLDENENGIQDPGEPGVAGVKVYLLDEAGNVIRWTKTDENGAYLFAKLVEGEYRVRFELPAGYGFTAQGASPVDANSKADPDTGETHLVVLECGGEILDLDAGLVVVPPPPGSSSIALTKTGTLRIKEGGTCPPLGMAAQFNALIFGNLEAHGGDTDARLAVAGNVEIHGGYSVGHVVKGDPLPTFSGGETDIFIVGGDLVDGNFGVNGNIVHAGTRTGPVRHMTNGNLIRQVNPITFDANGNVPSDGSGVTFEQLHEGLSNLSALLGAMEDRGVVTKDTSKPWVIMLKGDDEYLNVFNLSADEWSISSAGIEIEAPAGSTVLINIHGDEVVIGNVGMQLRGVNERNILYNYVDATWLRTFGFAKLGSVLAPYASAHLSSGSIDGRSILGGDVLHDNGFEFHNFPFDGSICLEVLYEFAVKNTGDTVLTEITIDDPMVEVVGGPISLNPGETDSTTFTAVYSLDLADVVNGVLENTATVSGTTPANEIVTDTATHSMVVPVPALGLPTPISGGGAGSGGGESGGGDSGPGDTGGDATPSPVESWMMADFVMNSVVLSQSPSVTGETFGVTVVVSNQGHKAADAGVLRVWSTAPGAAAPGGKGDAWAMVGILNPGQSKEFTFNGLKASSSAGTWFVVATVDADDLTPEYSVGNNSLPVAYTVSSDEIPSWMKPDFVVQNITLLPSPTVTGARFEAVVRVANIGDIPGDGGVLRFWSRSPSWNNLPDDADVEVEVGILNVGEVVEFTVSDLRAPSNQGTYFVRAVVNANETTAEKSFGNNHGGAAYTVHPLVAKIEVVPGEGNKISWNSSGGFIYHVERSTSLSGEFEEIAGGITATPPVNAFVDAEPPAGAMVFYRVWGYRP